MLGELMSIFGRHFHPLDFYFYWRRAGQLNSNVDYESGKKAIFAVRSWRKESRCYYLVWSYSKIAQIIKVQTSSGIPSSKGSFK